MATPVAHAPALRAAAPASVSGPLGRVFHRILGQPDNRTDTTALRFNGAQWRAYLDTTLCLAEGEVFRAAKLDGVAKKPPRGAWHLTWREVPGT